MMNALMNTLESMNSYRTTDDEVIIGPSWKIDKKRGNALENWTHHRHAQVTNERSSGWICIG